MGKTNLFPISCCVTFVGWRKLRPFDVFAGSCSGNHPISCLDKRPAGLLAAFLLMLRERNAMALSNIIQVSHTKLLLSDVFAMGEMILLVWLVVWWLQNPVERRAVPIAVG